MSQKVFLSFHYDGDCHRASQVRYMGAIEDQQVLSSNDWEEVKRGGKVAIKQWIYGQMRGKNCEVVLIGGKTAGREWINYEIETAWNAGKGVVGVYIHKLLDLDRNQTCKGGNPFNWFSLNDRNFAQIAPAHDPGLPLSTSKQVYAEISDNLSFWIDQAIKIRAQYPSNSSLNSRNPNWPFPRT